MEQLELKRLVEGPLKRTADALQSTYPSYQDPKRSCVALTELPSWTSPSGMRALEARRECDIPDRIQSPLHTPSNSTPNALTGPLTAFLPHFSPESSPSTRGPVTKYLLTPSAPIASPRVEPPTCSLSLLVSLAIESSLCGSRLVREIYCFIQNEFEFYLRSHCRVNWQNAVRHCLSGKDAFEKVAAVSFGETCKYGCHWTLSASRQVLVQKEIFEFLQEGAVNLRHYQGLQKYYDLLDQPKHEQSTSLVVPIDLAEPVDADSLVISTEGRQRSKHTDMPAVYSLGDLEEAVQKFDADSLLNISMEGLERNTPEMPDGDDSGEVEETMKQVEVHNLLNTYTEGLQLGGMEMPCVYPGWEEAMKLFDVDSLLNNNYDCSTKGRQRSVELPTVVSTEEEVTGQFDVNSLLNNNYRKEGQLQTSMENLWPSDCVDSLGDSERVKETLNFDIDSFLSTKLCIAEGHESTPDFSLEYFGWEEALKQFEADILLNSNTAESGCSSVTSAESPEPFEADAWESDCEVDVYSETSSDFDDGYDADTEELSLSSWPY